MIFKKIFIGISLILSLSATAAFASELPFNDVTEQTPYYSAVDRLYNMGIISWYADGALTLLPCPINGRIGFLQNAAGIIILN